MRAGKNTIVGPLHVGQIRITIYPALNQDFVEYVCTQSGLEGGLSYKKMFGEYALYLSRKVVAFACDNQLYLKPPAEGRSILRKVSEHPPYPGAKLHFRIDEELEDRDLLQQVLLATVRALPPSKPKVAKGKTRSKVR